MTRIVAAFLMALPLAIAAQPAPPPPARAEIDHLLDYISSSACRFDRNGSVHDMAAARSHVNAKYEYLAARGKIASAEDFIDQAASASSISGKQYLVLCAGGPPVPSGSWLREELERFRRKK